MELLWLGLLFLVLPEQVGQLIHLDRNPLTWVGAPVLLYAPLTKFGDLGWVRDLHVLAEFLIENLGFPRHAVEVFVNGKQCVGVRVYPSRDDSIGVSLRSQSQDSRLKSLDAWQMKNIYT